MGQQVNRISRSLLTEFLIEQGLSQFFAAIYVDELTDKEKFALGFGARMCIGYWLLNRVGEENRAN